MAVVDVLRPLSVRKAGAGVAVPSGTLASVTSDNSDSTYIQFPTASAGNNWNLRVESHTPDPGYQRHAIRGRIRIRTDAGTASEDIDVGRGTSNFINYGTVSVTDTMAEKSTAWFQNAAYGLNTAGALSDLNIGGGWTSVNVGATETRTAECYIDVDCRLKPQFDPEIQDSAGVDRTGGTVTDTTAPTLFIGGVDYDGLPPLGWAVAVYDASNVQVFRTSSNGIPPTEVPLTVSLDDGAYTANFYVSSTIRGADEFGALQTLAFSVQNVVPPPSPPLVTVTEDSGGYLVSWQDPGGQAWDNGYVVAEVWRTDCNGTARIATVPDGLNGSYLDLAIPQLDPQPVPGVDCEESSSACDVTYQVRYFGYVSTTVELPDTIPADLILGWPSTAASIPSGWSRVTALDGVFPRGASGSGVPSATGGSLTHSHTTPSHTHTIGAHSHSVGGNTGSSNSSTTSARFNGATQAQADQPHSHARPSSTGTSGSFASGSAAPGTNSMNNSPPFVDVIWIRSNGAQASYPVGVVGWATESVSGWGTYATANGRYLQGAPAGGNGGANGNGPTHDHIIASHSHTGRTHDHSIGSTGLSNPSSSQEAGYGVSTPRWLPRHTHPMDVGSASTGNTTSNGGGTTGLGNHEPPNRRLRVLQNTGGGTQTRIIGLFTGAISALDPLLTWCNGSNGTPDMRTYFARDAGSDSINSTGGSTTHTHSTPNHSHSMGSHSHTTNVLTSTTTSYEAPSFGDLGDSPTVSHDHSSGNTGSAAPSVSSSGSGTSGAGNHIPPYKEVHFVRLDGTISGGPLPVPELKVSAFSSATMPALTYGDGLDRLANLDGVKLAVATDRSSTLPRLVADSTPLDGGLHTVSTTEPGEDVTLVIAVEGVPAIDALEDLLASDRVYWSPVGGTPGWYAPGSWSVTRPVPGVWVVQVTMVRQPWPTTDDPEDYL